MTITIKYFGLIADITHIKEEVFTSADHTLMVEDLISHLSQKYGDLSQASFVIAVNQNVTATNLSLHDRDVLAILPPFAGG